MEEKNNELKFIYVYFNMIKNKIKNFSALFPVCFVKQQTFQQKKKINK